MPLILMFVIGQAYENIIGKNASDNTSMSLPLIRTTTKKEGKEILL